MSEPQVMRDYEKWSKSVRNFEWLAGKVPGACDIDVIVERKGRFLVLEAKDWSNGINVPFGQHLMLDAMSRLEMFDVFLVGEGKTDTFYLLRYDDSPPVRNGTRPVWFPPKRFQRTTKEGLGIMVGEWYKEMSAA